MSRLTQTFTTDNSQAIKAIDGLLGKVARLAAEHQKLVNVSKDASAEFQKEAHDHAAGIGAMQRDLLKLHAAEQKRGEAAKQNADGDRKHSSQFHQYVDGQTKSLKNMLLSYVGIETAIQAVVGAYRDWHQMMEKLAESSEKLNKSVIKGATQAGDLANLDRIQAAGEQHQVATREQFQEAFRAVNDASPNMTLERRLGVATEAARTAPLELAPGEIGAIAGELADALPGLKPADIADLAVLMQEKGGADREAISSSSFQRSTAILADTGAMDQYQALAMGVGASVAELDPRTLEKLSAKLVDKIEVPKLPKNRKLTETEQQFREFAGADSATRFQMLQGNKPLQQQVLGATLANKFQQIDMETVNKRAAEYRAVGGKDLIAERVQQLGQTAVGQESIVGQRQAKDLDTSLIDEEQQARAAKRAYDDFKRRLAEDNAGFVQRMIRTAKFWADEFGYNVAGYEADDAAQKALRNQWGSGLAPELNPILSNDYQEDEQFKRFMEAEGAIKGKRKVGPRESMAPAPITRDPIMNRLLHELGMDNSTAAAAATPVGQDIAATVLGPVLGSLLIEMKMLNVNVAKSSDIKNLAAGNRTAAARNSAADYNRHSE